MGHTSFFIFFYFFLGDLGWGRQGSFGEGRPELSPASKQESLGFELKRVSSCPEMTDHYL